MEAHQAASGGAPPAVQYGSALRSASQQRPVVPAEAPEPVDQAEISAAARVMAQAAMDMSPTLQLAPDRLRAMSTGQEG